MKKNLLVILMLLTICTAAMAATTVSTIRFKRGPEAKLLITAPVAGEPLYTTDTHRVFVNTSTSRVELLKTESLKTVNGQSLIGSGDLAVAGGGGNIFSVFGRTGTVVSNAGDYTVSQITNAESILNKGANNGYAALNSVGLIPAANHGTGTADTTTYLRGDLTWATVTGGAGISSLSSSSPTTFSAGTILASNGTTLRAAVPGTDILLPGGSGAGLTGITVGQITGAENTSNKGAPFGYAPLGGAATIPPTNLATGAASSSVFLRGDGTWAATPNTPFSGITGNVSDSTALATALNLKENSANKGAVNGYAPLNSGGQVPAVNLGSGMTTSTYFLRRDSTWQQAVMDVTGTGGITSSGGATPNISITAATTSAAGSMSAADKTKLDFVDSSTSYSCSSTLASVSTTLAATHFITLGAGCSITAWGLPASGTKTVTYFLVQDAIGSRTISSWPAGTIWLGGGTTPTLTTAANAIDTVTCKYTTSAAYCAFAPK